MGNLISTHPHSKKLQSRFRPSFCDFDFNVSCKVQCLDCSNVVCLCVQWGSRPWEPSVSRRVAADQDTDRVANHDQAVVRHGTPPVVGAGNAALAPCTWGRVLPDRRWDMTGTQRTLRDCSRRLLTPMTGGYTVYHKPNEKISKAKAQRAEHCKATLLYNCIVCCLLLHNRSVPRTPISKCSRRIQWNVFFFSNLLPKHPALGASTDWEMPTHLCKTALLRSQKKCLLWGPIIADVELNGHSHSTENSSVVTHGNSFFPRSTRKVNLLLPPHLV